MDHQTPKGRGLYTKNLKRRLFWILHPPSRIDAIKENIALIWTKCFWLFAKLVYDGTNFDELNIWCMAKLIQRPSPSKIFWRPSLRGSITCTTNIYPLPARKMQKTAAHKFSSAFDCLQQNIPRLIVQHVVHDCIFRSIFFFPIFSFIQLLFHAVTSLKYESLVPFIFINLMA